MEFGLFVNTQQSTGGDPAELVDELVSHTRRARESGFDLVMTGQHYLTTDDKLQTIPVLSRLAAEAGSMAVGTGVLLLPLHHPVEVAEQLTTLDAIADRAILGVGAGYRDTEFEGFGVPKAERAARLEEGVELVERLWTEESVTYEGDHYRVEDATINPRPPEKPPVWVGANVTSAVERAARIGDRWFVGPQATLPTIRERKEPYDRIREADGRSTAVSVLREAFVAETHERAMDLVRDALEYKYRHYRANDLDDAMEDDSFSLDLEALAEDQFLVGTPAEVCAELERYERECEVDTVLLRMHWPGLDHDLTRASIELAGDEVLPNV
ncbi:MAG: LLM class flavin-dependent oxidoreductase [Haloarculaceae archaeon]